eukprot:4357158-Heterocapsa_arctica.AAC.1
MSSRQRMVPVRMSASIPCTTWSTRFKPETDSIAAKPLRKSVAYSLRAAIHLLKSSTFSLVAIDLNFAVSKEGRLIDAMSSK